MRATKKRLFRECLILLQLQYNYSCWYLQFTALHTHAGTNKEGT